MIPNADVQDPINISLAHADKAREAAYQMTAAYDAFTAEVSGVIEKSVERLKRDIQKALDSARSELGQLASEVAVVEKRAEDATKKAKANEENAAKQIAIFKEHVAEHERAASIAAGKVQALNAKLDILRQKAAALID